MAKLRTKLLPTLLFYFLEILFYHKIQAETWMHHFLRLLMILIYLGSIF